MFEPNAADKHLPRVEKFYDGKSVFLTGSAGFLGTILLETLLRCCPGIKTIYILLRVKKNVQPEDRKGEIFNKKVFEKLKETPDLIKKVRVIPGDISLPNLGMSEDDVKLLIDEVSIVFHCAAFINFSKPLKFVLSHNVLSVDSIIELCRRMRKFEALVFTSSAYSNSNYTEFALKEEVYRLPFRAEKFLDALKNGDDEKLQELYAHCKPDWSNTYTFSKCLAENVINDTASDLPVAIIRPSIIISVLKDPLPGYIEENSGIAALTLGVGKGFVKVLYADPNIKLNFVPVDIVAKTHVIAAWSLGTNRCVPPLVVHCSATEKFHIKLSEYRDTMSELSTKFPLPQSFEEYTHLLIIPNKYLHYILSTYHHYLPAIVLDGILRILGKKPRVYPMYRFFDKVMGFLNFFLFHTFEMERNNLEYLDKLIHPEERKHLSLDFKDATFRDITLKIPEVSPFYDWKIDKRSPSERQKIKYRRHIIINCIQGIFVAIFCLFIYWILSLFVL